MQPTTASQATPKHYPADRVTESYTSAFKRAAEPGAEFAVASFFECTGFFWGFVFVSLAW
jgi:hypothetical protein